MRRLDPSGGTNDWIDLSQSVQSIDHDWITSKRELESDARCIIVVEKDGIFRRLIDDGFYTTTRPC
jgi:DNA topoisomerase VI subunit A